MIRCFILLLYAYTILGIGYDAGGSDRTTCGRPYRAGRVYQPPCDLRHIGYCSQAGQLYPWRAVKRFVKDNQGLMRRMYGDQRHGHVLRTELEEGHEFEEEWEKDEKEKGGYGRWRPEPIRFARYQHPDEINNDLEEDLEFGSPYAGESRYFREDLTNEDVLNTKFVISEQEAAIAIKLAELKAAAHFRPATHRSTFTIRRTPSSAAKTPEITTTQKSISTTSRKTTVSTTESKKQPITTKTSYGVTVDSYEATTGKQDTITGTARTTLIDSTEESTLATTPSTTDDFIDHSTIYTTTDRATESLTNNTSTTTKKPVITEKQFTEKTTTVKSLTGKITASDRLGEATDTNDSITIEVIDQKSDSSRFKSHQNKTNDSAENFKNSDQISHENFDQTVESSEKSEFYSDSDGNVKQVGIGNTPAVLFQDMAEEPSKKKMPMNFNKMKGVNACPVKEEVVAPFWANNTRGEVLALLNMYPFEQYVHWEKCTFEHRQMYCREGCRCEQQYRLHRLLAYDPNNECRGIFSDWFRFPSCCVCKCYDMPPEFRVTSRSPRFQVAYPENEEDYQL